MPVSLQAADTGPGVRWEELVGSWLHAGPGLICGSRSLSDLRDFRHCPGCSRSSALLAVCASCPALSAVAGDLRAASPIPLRAGEGCLTAEHPGGVEGLPQEAGVLAGHSDRHAVPGTSSHSEELVSDSMACRAGK